MTDSDLQRLRADVLAAAYAALTGDAPADLQDELARAVGALAEACQPDRGASAAIRQAEMAMERWAAWMARGD